MIRKSFFALSAVLLAAMEPGHAMAAPAAGAPTNYVEFYILGDCHQEDCIAAVTDALADDKPQIYSMKLEVLAPHDVTTYKIVKIAFVDIKKAPFEDVMEKIAGLGYDVKSYVIHDTSKGKDVIIPH